MGDMINGSALLGSGGHVWIWEPRNRFEKVIELTGATGAFSQVTCQGSRNARIAGRGGVGANGHALLVADDDGSLSALESGIEVLVDSGQECNWNDDQGHLGTQLVLVKYARQGHRIYSGGHVWQYYTLDVRENSGWIYG